MDHAKTGLPLGSTPTGKSISAAKQATRNSQTAVTTAEEHKDAPANTTPAKLYEPLNVAKLSKAELINHLKGKGLPTTGIKTELQKRLRKYLAVDTNGDDLVPEAKLHDSGANTQGTDDVQTYEDSPNKRSSRRGKAPARAAENKAAAPPKRAQTKTTDRASKRTKVEAVNAPHVEPDAEHSEDGKDGEAGVKTAATPAPPAKTTGWRSGRAGRSSMAADAAPTLSDSSSEDDDSTGDSKLPTRGRRNRSTQRSKPPPATKSKTPANPPSRKRRRNASPVDAVVAATVEAHVDEFKKHKRGGKAAQGNLPKLSPKPSSRRGAAKVVEDEGGEVEIEHTEPAADDKKQPKLPQKQIRKKGAVVKSKAPVRNSRRGSAVADADDIKSPKASAKGTFQAYIYLAGTFCWVFCRCAHICCQMGQKHDPPFFIPAHVHMHAPHFSFPAHRRKACPATVC